MTKMGTVVEDFHGTKVRDPYRWLEDPNSEETKEWGTAQNQKTNDYLNSVGNRSKIKSRMIKFWNYEKFSVPQKVGGRYFFFKNDGLQNQAVLYMQKGLEAEPEMIIDPNTFSEDGTVALMNISFSKDGKKIAYGVSASGSDWQEVRVRDTDTGRDYDEVIRWTKFRPIAWSIEHNGFFYSRFPEPGSVSPEDQNNYNQVYWHTLGTAQSEDVIVYERPDAKELGFAPIVTDDGRYLILHVSLGTDWNNRIYYREAGQAVSNTGFTHLLDEADAHYSFIGNEGTIFYFHTDLDASRGRIIAIDIDKPDRANWREVLPEQEDVISHVTLAHQQFVVVTMHHAHHQVKIYSRNGSFSKEISLPTIGSVSGMDGSFHDKELFIGITSYLYPTHIFRYDFTTDQLETFRKPELSFDPNEYETKQVFYHSKDDTRVPMFITHKKGLKLDGNNPTLLYGYGGFNVSLTPTFSASTMVWLEQGGVYAVANLRGGSEYGEEWHQAGRLEKKQNVFDDFISAAEWLINNQYTQTSKLAIMGRSNGGLLVGACMVQRPELFGAVICNVPVIDMLRYHKFTVGRYWIPEYGNAETNPEHFKFMYAYSPLHNVKEGVHYPPILIGTAETDDRVVPAHAMKFTATLQAANASDHPVLLRLEKKAGHGGGKPTLKVIEEDSDFYAFLNKVFGMER
jgi:prolyl oligopeptidase